MTSKKKTDTHPKSKSVRLSTDLKDAICNDVLVHAYSEKFDALFEESKAFSKDVIETVTRKWQPFIKSVKNPELWLAKTSYFRIQFGVEKLCNISSTGLLDWSCTNNLSPLKSHLAQVRKNPEPFYIPASVADTYNGTSIISFNSFPNANLTDKENEEAKELIKRYQDLHLRVGSLRDEYKLSKSEIYSVVNACTTTGGLIGRWPEIEEFVRPHEPESGAKLPTTVLTAFKGLNSKLNLKG